MAEVVIDTREEPLRRRVRRDWARRLLNELFALFVALLFLLAGLLVLLDSAPGHRFIVDQAGSTARSSGCRSSRMSASPTRTGSS
jgi:translocation and assembly module TamB